ncbi:TetR/AcrR family transcriptional regulator [uncultured Roseibium sp.]|uniref:TetR/AcrR family transcriptional regulator n=1 Tax=uncultured Roseibium sp. TaxID=1936171 RepID=UPI0032165FC2
MRNARTGHAVAGKTVVGDGQASDQRGSRRRHVLDAACQLFYENGYASASMRDLASAVGVTQAAIYYHFANKEEILFALIEDFNHRLHDVLSQAFSSEADPAQGLRAAIKAHILLGRSCYREFKLVTEDKQQLTSEFAAQMRVRERQIFDLYKEAITAIHAQQAGPSLDGAVCAFNIFAMINFVFKWYRPDGELSLEEIARQTVAFALAGVNAASTD